MLRDVASVLDAVPAKETTRFVEAILGARRVFMYGLGRSGLVARMFGMRLVHLGRDATIVGDSTTPAIRAPDLLVVCSRTGQSPILHHAVGLAHNEEAKAVAVTGLPRSPLAPQVDFAVRLPLEVARGEQAQPMGSLFEQALLVYLDSVVLRLMDELQLTEAEMARIHSNLP